MPGDPEITDQDLGSEIELLADVITAASGAEQTLSQEQIDSALGVCIQEPGEAPAVDSDAVAPPGPAADGGC